MVSSSHAAIHVPVNAFLKISTKASAHDLVSALITALRFFVGTSMMASTRK